MKKLLIIFFTASCIVSFQSAKAMLPQAASRASGKIAQYFTKESLKKGFSHAMSAYHWYLCGGYLGKMCFEKAKQLVTIENYSDANQEVTQFITEEMQHLSPNNHIKSVKYDPSLTRSNDGAIDIKAVGANHIVIGLNTHLQIGMALAKNNTNELNQCRSLLQRENQRIQNRDTYSDIAVCVAMPLMTHWSCKALSSSLPFATKAPSFFRKQLSKVTTGMLQGGINLLSYNALRRYQAQQTDNGINDDLDSLNGLKEVLQPYADAHRARFDAMSTRTNVPVETYEKGHEQLNVLNQYPTAKSRLDILNGRIATIEQRNHVERLLENYSNSENKE